ncbi:MULTISPECIES: sensor histidine kinase [Sphingobacterium]|uniref:sensor histidine kinase n=1 Tax=Sphingobacterium TaxID=28453 RepID=UPI0013DC8B8E|nr:MULTISPECIES: HAMP domain-containing sensor histidine kinase [unclassified Sphingobacterium]
MQLAEAASGNIFFPSREGFLALDKTGVILAYNEQATILLDSLPLIVGNNFLLNDSLFYPIEDNLKFRPTEMPWSKTLRNGTAQQDIVLGIKQKEGNNIWLSFSSKQIDTPTHSYVIISFFDVSRIVEQNILLIAKEEQLNLLVSSLNDMVFEVTQDGCIINYWTNDSGHLFFQPTYFLGKSLNSIFPEFVAIPFQRLIEETITTGIEQEMDFLSPFESHKNYWYHLQVKSITKRNDRVAVVISDITKEVENTEKIKLNENKFNQAFHFSGVGMSLTALDGYCLDANKVLCNMLGYTKKELQKVTFIELTHPDDVQGDLELRKKLLDSEIESFTIEKRYQHKSGHYVWCDTTVSIVRNHKHYPQFYIAQIQNISQVKLNIETLESQKAELESIKVELETKVRQLEEFNQIVAHNLRGPVCNIQMLLTEINSETDESRKKAYFSLLKCSGDNLNQTLEELTDILELKQDVSLSFQKCSFQDQLNKIYLHHLVEIKRKDALLTTDFKIEHVHYPAIYLDRILDNLLSNALKYTAVDRQPKINISTYSENDNVFLRISDNGIGIDLPKFKSQLFMFKKIFHRGFDSKGIGLFTTRYLVENLGGKIDVESNLGEGSSFVIQF